ncbi:ComEC/Rec2 family competence protein [Microbacterium phyllosphaerae]|uniref:ComEC/Rec2 family competence protein n=1 Tax=Microbacterium phyllosphaerae TaxID=124798 RepID=UPI000EA257BC|nr:ComEC/Rec2 family competence protein [Microbacterium phyllosphaerae]
MRRDLRLLPVAGGVWAAALLCVFIPAAAGWCALAGGVGAVIVGAVVLRRADRAASRAALMVVLLAAIAAVSLSAMSSLPGRKGAASWDGRVVELTGEITSSASVGRDERLWVEVQLTGIGSPGAVREASSPVRIGIDPADGFDLGATVRVTGEAAATDSGERSALVVFGSTAAVESPASGVFAMAADVRGAFVERSSRLPEPGAGLLPGLAVGDTRAVSTALSDDMRTSGLSHLTAVSGANCAIVVGAAFWFAALCGAGRATRVVAAAVVLAGFVVLVTPEPSVIRAAVMAGVAMLSLLLGRPSAGAGMLALSAAGILIADPWLASTPGFALSVAASGALIMLSPSLTRGLARWMPHPLALAIAVPTAAQLVCGPVIALFAEQQSLVGLVANLLAAPAAPIATIIGLLACLTAPLPAVADLLAASAWLPAAWIAETATFAARLPFAQIVMEPGIASAALVAVVSGAIGVILVDGFRRGRIVRGVASGILAVVLALGGAHIVLDGPLASATNPDGWSVAACDVGQGDALVIRSEGRIALIDTGPAPEPVAACLRALGIDRVDLLVLTHFDLDHVGGVEAVQGRVDTVLHGPTGESGDERMLQRLGEGGATVTPATAGLHGELGAASWQVLWPQRGSTVFPPGNDQSVVLEVGGGEVPRSLFLGDLSAEAQRMLSRTAHIRGSFAVVKVAHHGSADQDAQLYVDLHPLVALFSAGVDNDYGHPRAETLASLAATGARVLRTDQQGRLLVGLEDGALQLWTEKQPP